MPSMPSIITASMTVAIAFFAILQLLDQNQDRAARVALTTFLLSIAAIEASTLVLAFDETFGVAYTVFSLAPYYLVMPSFWFYVRALTRQDEPVWSAQSWVHLAPAAFALLVFALFCALPLAERNPLSSDAGGFEAIVALSVFAVIAPSLFVILGYMFASLRRLARYRKRLHDHFASTEQREMRWLVAVAVVMGLYWCFLFAQFSLSQDAPSMDLWNQIDAALALVLTASVGAWGLRQRRGFDPADTQSAQPDAEAAKYRKSALTEAESRRIAAKIEHKMTHEKLFLNPGLSLRSLAAAINVLPNYVSQTLNETLGVTFFDYVNRLRVREALARVAVDAETIGDIANDVGFNSRSAFYAAFKRETGMTPTAYRKRMASPAAAAVEPGAEKLVD